MWVTASESHRHNSALVQSALPVVCSSHLQVNKSQPRIGSGVSGRVYMCRMDPAYGSFTGTIAIKVHNECHRPPKTTYYTTPSTESKTTVHEKCAFNVEEDVQSTVRDQLLRTLAKLASVRVETRSRRLSRIAGLRRPQSLVPLLFGTAARLESNSLHACTATPYFPHGTVHDYLLRSVTVTPWNRVASALRMVEDVANALEYLHLIRVTHTDLKPENIAVSQVTSHKQPWGFTLIDLDECFLDEGKHSKKQTVVGAEKYRAPEVNFEKGAWNELVDVWGLACCFFVMLTSLDMPEALQTGAASLNEDPWEPFELNGAWRLLLSMLAWNPQERASAQNVVTWCNKHLPGLLDNLSKLSHMNSAVSPQWYPLSFPQLATLRSEATFPNNDLIPSFYFEARAKQHPRVRKASMHLPQSIFGWAEPQRPYSNNVSAEWAVDVHGH